MASDVQRRSWGSWLGLSGPLGRRQMVSECLAWSWSTLPSLLDGPPFSSTRFSWRSCRRISSRRCTSAQPSSVPGRFLVVWGALRDAILHRHVAARMPSAACRASLSP